MAWDPHRYEAHLEARLRPGLELAARVPGSPRSIVDLGCGTGRLSVHLANRWPDARVIGVDRDQGMLAEARRRSTAVSWIEADLRDWQPERPVDLIFSNAALHWVDDHPRLIARLAGMLTPGGALAVQMPRNHDRPTHTAITAEAADPRWAERLTPLLRPQPVATPTSYFRVLSELGLDADVWETDYLHRLEGPVLSWVEGSVLRPLLDALTPEEAEQLRRRLDRRYQEAYPPEPDGSIVVPFRRLFWVAVTARRRGASTVAAR